MNAGQYKFFRTTTSRERARLVARVKTYASHHQGVDVGSLKLYDFVDGTLLSHFHPVISLAAYELL